MTENEIDYLHQHPEYKKLVDYFCNFSVDVLQLFAQYFSGKNKNQRGPETMLQLFKDGTGNEETAEEIIKQITLIYPELKNYLNPTLKFSALNLQEINEAISQALSAAIATQLRRKEGR